MFFLLLTIGRLVGGAILTIVSPLAFFRLSALLGLMGTTAIMTGSHAAAIAGVFAAGFGFANIWPLLFSLTVEEKPERASELSGLMCMAISGGALVPLMMGAVVDRGFHATAFVVPAACFAYLLTLSNYRVLGRPRKPEVAMKIDQDQRIVMTLDAGGTNFVFSAMQAAREIIAPITLPSNAHDLPLCLKTIVDGFTRVRDSLPEAPVAISFAFPGPADYVSGIIGDLPNLPAFRGGVALGPMLEAHFGLPVYLNNDGDLFAYGEAISGFLPYINEKLAAAGSAKRYRNLFGITLGTGFGGGLAHNDDLFLGDNGAAAEIWVMCSKRHGPCFVEEDVSIRAVQRSYAEHSGKQFSQPPTPKEICDIALGKAAGDRAAALRAFDDLGESIGDALADALTLIDGLAVIGGGLAGAAPLFLPRVIREINGTIENLKGDKIPRLELKAYNLEDAQEMADFLRGDAREIAVPGTDTKVAYDPLKRVGIGLSRLGTSLAVAVGAYAFALKREKSR